MNLEDLKKIYKLIELSNKYSRADRFDFDLYKLKSIIDILKPKLADGVICLAVNDILSDVNNFYRTNFVCVKDDEYAYVINEVREYIKNDFNNEMKTEVLVELAKLLNNNDFKP